MTDRISPEERSAQMRRITKTDTKPELAVRRAAHRLGYRFRLHRRDLPGTPDLVFPRLRKVILVSWLLLASARWLPLGTAAEEPARLLAAKARAESEARR